MKVIALKIESYDSDEFIKKLYDYDEEALVYLQTIDGYKLNGKLVLKWSKNNAIDLFKISMMILWNCIKYKPKVLFLENTYVACLIGRWHKTIYVSTDWLSHPLFPFFDLWACRNATATITTTESVKIERILCWHWMVPRKEIKMPFILKRSFIYGLDRKKILFLGRIRPDSGLDIAFNNSFFEVVTPYPLQRNQYRNIARNCFCGINLITNGNSFSSKSFPSKILDYLQLGLPPIITENCGEAVEVVREFNLGEVIKPTQEEFDKAVISVFKLNSFYRNNIFNWFDMQPKVNLEDMLESV